MSMKRREFMALLGGAVAAGSRAANKRDDCASFHPITSRQARRS
jgi:hypothetical protein